MNDFKTKYKACLLPLIQIKPESEALLKNEYEIKTNMFHGSFSHSWIIPRPSSLYNARKIWENPDQGPKLSYRLVVYSDQAGAFEGMYSF
jgi:hypothetical protein